MENKLNSATRERILDVAERQFMVHGYDATSMRMITRAAQVNLAAVNYHFGSKEELLREVFRRRLSWLNNERLSVLDALEEQANGQPLKPSQVLEAFFGPLLHIGEVEALGGMTFLRLLGRTLTDPSEFITTFFADEYAEVIERYKQALIRSVPDVPRAEIVWRLHFMLGAMSYAIAGTDILHVITGVEMGDYAGQETGNKSEATRLSERLMPFLLGGLRAPLPHIAEVSSQNDLSPARANREGKEGEKRMILQTVVLFVMLVLAGSVLVCAVPRLRRALLTRAIFRTYKSILPQMSETERDALEAGTVWWEGELFQGDPDWNKLLAYPVAKLSAEEQSFMDNEVEQVCALVDDWQVTTELHDMSPAAWSYVKAKGFLGLIIPKAYGGLGFSAYAHSQVVTKLSTRCSALSVSVMVPNSLGPAELLMHYGTEAQKNHLSAAPSQRAGYSGFCADQPVGRFRCRFHP